MTNGPQREHFDLTFEVPAVCADHLASGVADIGLVPCAELDRLGLDFFPETGIACCGPVRSILLISRVDPSQIRTLAADNSSRSSVMLSRILLAERYGATPEVVSHPPSLEPMLARADAALIIGDPALHIEPSQLPYLCLDLGEEWMQHTGLPMVFAVWAGRRRHITAESGAVFESSLDYGLARIEGIVRSTAAAHGVTEELARTYLTRHIVFRLGPEYRKGLELYRRKVREHSLAGAGLLR